MTRSPDPLSSLSTVGVQISIGPFLVRLRSPLAEVDGHLKRLYADFPMRVSDGAGHFDIAILPGRGGRRWIRRQSSVIVNGVRPFLPLPHHLAGPSLEWALNWSIGSNAHLWIAVHAAVVERSGRTLILPGSSGSGKSTLCAALTGVGWRLFSDEFALIDVDTGQVVPLPRPISLKNAAIEIIRRRQPHAVFGLQARDMEGAQFVHMRPLPDSVARANQRAHPAWLILPRFVAGHPTTLEPLPKARALMHLTDQSFNYNYMGSSGYRCLAELVRQVDCYRLEYGDLDDVLGVLERLTS